MIDNQPVDKNEEEVEQINYPNCFKDRKAVVPKQKKEEIDDRISFCTAAKQHTEQIIKS